jgi:hypothetical protein
MADGLGELPFGKYIPVALAAFFLLILFRMSQRRRGAARRTALEAGPRAARDAKSAPIGTTARQDPEIAKLYIELSEFSRELEGRMDTKIAYLRRLLDEAERVMGQLNRAIGEADALRAGRATPAAGIAEAPGREAHETVVEVSRTESMPREREALPEPLAGPEPALVDVTVGGSPAAREVRTASSVEETTSAVPPGEDLRSRIVALSGEGKPPEAIAEALEVPKGEVELVLSLERAAARKSGAARR